MSEVENNNGCWNCNKTILLENGMYYHNCNGGYKYINNVWICTNWKGDNK